MALDQNLLSEFVSNILYHRFEHIHDKESWSFWTAEACSRADSLVRQVGDSMFEKYTHDSIKKAVDAKLSTDLDFRKNIEKEFAFTPLISLLARNWIADPAKVRPDSVAEYSTVDDLIKYVADTGNRDDKTRKILETALFLNEDLAAEVALAFDEALPYPWVRKREFKAVKKSRELRKVEPTQFETARDGQLLGLAFSGGGIRSATFNLGILQAFAELKLLKYFDYLSTVSGGGYIGSWLHALIKGNKDQENVRESLSPRVSPDPESFATRPIKWLRRYSNYLAPRRGLLSVDTWSVGTIWMRNTLLNLLVIILALSALLLAPRMMRIVFDLLHSGALWQKVILSFTIGLLFHSVWVIRLNLHSFNERRARDDGQKFYQNSIHLLVALPIMVSSLFATAWMSTQKKDSFFFLIVTALIIVLLSILTYTKTYQESLFKGKSTSLSDDLAFNIAALIFNTIAAAVGGALLYAYGYVINLWKDDKNYIWHQLVWGPIVIVMICSLVIILHIGFIGRDLPEDRREWWSRLGSVLMVWLIGWISLACISIYGPCVLQWAESYFHTYIAKIVASGAVVLGWIGTTVAGIMKAHSADTGPMGSKPKSDLIARIAPPIFIAGLLLLLSLGVSQLIRVCFYVDPDTLPGAFYVWSFLSLLLAAIFLSMRVDVNEFSMHNFYENRLVRCYLGASRPNRKPNRFTGFDPEDDFKLTDLDPWKEYPGPYPIVNTALNIVSGEELAWQERKSESFVFTPMFSGFAVTPTEEGGAKCEHGKHLCLHGYRRTTDYAFTGGGIQMGKALAISGAAASPNMGYHTSTATAFLMTVFNVRLGWWIGNPRHRKSWQKPGPHIGLACLLNELAAAANNKSRYVYLSDGGHFENLGLYELVRRRCRYIVVCDGGQDENFGFEDLGNAIRKCRADFGVEIDINLNSIRPRPAETVQNKLLSAAHCAIGTIIYPDCPRGTLVYLKSSLTGDEPSDVLEFATHHPEFPHTPTSDQFFDESHFESYRQLGYHVGNAVFEETVNRHRTQQAIDADREGFFADLRQRWFTSSPNVAKSFSRHAEVLAKEMTRLRTDPSLGFIETQFTPEWERLLRGATGQPKTQELGLPPTYEERRAGFHFCNSLMQLMENVYLDLNLEGDSSHPDKTGWLNLFNHWTWSAMFRATWIISASCYGSRFRRFCECKLGLKTDSIGNILVCLADGHDDSRLNFREKELIDKAGFDWENHRIYLLEINVTRPDPPHEVMIVLTVGFAVVTTDNKLAYLRVQEHLRNMGLAHRMLDAMVVDGQLPVERKPQWHNMPASFPEPVTTDFKESLERMLDAAHSRWALT